MLVTILCIILGLAIIGTLIWYFKFKGKKINSIKPNIHLKLSSKPKPPEYTWDFKPQSEKLQIFCAECVALNRKTIEDNIAHIDDLPEELPLETVERFGDDEEIEKPQEETPAVKDLIPILKSSEEYAKHILEFHPDSERIEWAKEYLKELESHKETVPKLKPKQKPSNDIELVKTT